MNDFQFSGALAIAQVRVQNMDSSLVVEDICCASVEISDDEGVVLKVSTVLWN